MSSPDPAPRLALWYTLAIGTAAAGPWYVLVLSRRGWTDAEAAAVAVVLPAGRLLVGPLWGYAADRWGARPVLRLVTVASAVGAIGLWWAEGPWASVAWLLLLAAVRPAASSLVDALAVARTGPRYGAVRAWGSASYLAIGVVVGLLADGWPDLVLLISAALAAGVVAATEALPTPPPLARPAVGARWWPEAPVLWLCAVATLHGVGLAVYDHLFTLHVAALGMPGWAQSLALASGVGAEIVLFRTAPRWFPRLDPWTWLLCAAAAGVPRFWLSALARDPVLLGLVQALHGVHFGVFWLAATELFVRHARPEWRNTIVSLLPTTVFGLGPIAALLAASALLGQRHETPALLFAAAGVSAGAAGVAAAARWVVTRRARR